MIITQSDIDDFLRVFEQHLEDFGDSLHNWIDNNPHVYLSAGFQEYVAPIRSSVYARIVRSRYLREMGHAIFRSYTGDWVQIAEPIYSEPGEEWDGFRIDAFATEERRLKLELEKLELDDDEHHRRDMELVGKSVVMLPSFDTIYASAEKYIDNPLLDPTVFVSPRLWTPAAQEREKLFLQESSLHIIRSLQAETRDLESLHWREFECIVAEVLRARGMEIHMADQVPQGGRDIIARAELVPGGEIITIAVEVKHRDVIDRPLVQQALQQNSHFPALLYVTSGRFTTGVLREAQRPDNRMRLMLKDGVAIRDLIKSYPL